MNVVSVRLCKFPGVAIISLPHSVLPSDHYYMRSRSGDMPDYDMGGSYEMSMQESSAVGTMSDSASFVRTYFPETWLWTLFENVCVFT